VSSPSSGTRFRDWLQRNKEIGLQADRVIDFRSARAVIETGTDHALLELLLGEGEQRREFLICPSAADHGIGLKLARRLTRIGAPYAFLPELRSLPAENVDIQSFAPDDVVAFVTRVNLQRPAAMAAKRLVDIALSLGGLVFLAPVLVPIAILVKLDGGPLFFGHLRVGRAGNQFRCWKFRTMDVDADRRLAELLATDPEAEAEWRRDQKLTHDPRVTPVGRFLREVSLDELPQLFNVLLGDMSLVGPRPVVLDELERYRDEAVTYLKVRPGLTGLWQVNGRNSTTYEERVRLDEYYVRNWTLWRDFVILVKTVPEVFGKGGM
jgi:undecaprenyl-phosphate galactose phosphotransferase